MFNCEVKIGGIGFNSKLDQPDEIEHIMPDYDLYGIDSTSMGWERFGNGRR